MGMSTDGLSYWQSESDGIPLFEISIGELLDRRAEEIPTQEAIVYSCYPEFGGALDIRLTYREYRERVNAIARGLLALGLNKVNTLPSGRPTSLNGRYLSWLLLKRASC